MHSWIRDHVMELEIHCIYERNGAYVMKLEIYWMHSNSNGQVVEAKTE